MTERLEIRVTGRVQGVAFRWYTREQAIAVGVVGSVRNLADGSVRIVAEGRHEALEALLLWARRGPRHAYVDHCEASWQPAQGGLTDFLVTG